MTTTTATHFVNVPEVTARRAAEWRYVLELIADGKEAELEALARLHGWRGPQLDMTGDGNMLAAIRCVADALTLPFG